MISEIRDMYEDEDDENEDEYDDFFFESIRRYNTLQIFKLENIPRHILEIDFESICVVSNLSKGKKSELLKLKLPQSLSLGPTKAGICKGYDFKIVNGVYTENIVWDINKLEDSLDSNEILVSEEDVKGLRIYNLQQSSDNQGKYDELKAVTWTKPNFSVLKNSSTIICSKSDHENVVVVNGKVDQVIKEISHPFSTNDFLTSRAHDKNALGDTPHMSNNIKCQALSPNLIAILNANNGNLVLHDIRTHNTITPITPVFGLDEGQRDDEYWSVSGTKVENGFGNYFGTASNRQSFNICDIRQNSILHKSVGNIKPNENHGNLRILFNCHDEKFSISGTDSFVQLFSYNGFMHEQIFTHRGHCPKNVSPYFVTDHIWVYSGFEEYIISICDNKTLNCWQAA